MGSYRLTPKARDGLREILEYVEAHFGTTTAEEVLERLLSAFELLAANPGAGHRRDDLTDDMRIRFWSVGPTLIAYRDGSRDSVEVLIVERGERDWERLLGRARTLSVSRHGDRTHLVEAHRLLTHLRDHAPDEDRDDDRKRPARPRDHGGGPADATVTQPA